MIMEELWNPNYDLDESTFGFQRHISKALGFFLPSEESGNRFHTVPSKMIVDGRKRHMGFRPAVRGSAMSPRDHPHGGGEGRSPIGMPSPKSPWGKPTLGKKTRRNKQTEKYIIRHRSKRRR